MTDIPLIGITNYGNQAYYARIKRLSEAKKKRMLETKKKRIAERSKSSQDTL